MIAHSNILLDTKKQLEAHGNYRPHCTFLLVDDQYNNQFYAKPDNHQLRQVVQLLEIIIASLSLLIEAMIKSAEIARRNMITFSH